VFERTWQLNKQAMFAGKKISILLVSVLFVSPFLRAQVINTADWRLVGQLPAKATLPKPPALFDFKISPVFRQPGLAYRQQLAKQTGVDPVKEWADYWDQRLETERYLLMARDAGGLLLLLNDTSVIYPFGAAGNPVVAAARSLPINRMYDHNFNRAVWELSRWEIELQGNYFFSLRNNLHGYLECSPQVKLNKQKGTGQLFRWVIFSLNNSVVTAPRIQTRDAEMMNEEIIFFRNAPPPKNYVLGLYNISQKVFVGLRMQQGRYEWMTISPVEFMAQKFPVNAIFNWDFLYPNPGLKRNFSVSKRFFAFSQWDMDGDGSFDVACGGDDCDDTDARRHPRAVEVCDPAGLDEDCNPATFGDRDADGDGFVSHTCCNLRDDGTLNCGTDCDDSRAYVNSASGHYLYINDSTVQEANCAGRIYVLPANQQAIEMPNGTAHVSYRQSPAAILPKQQKQ
jgi:hypothetical protein